MANWKQIQARIRKARTGGDAIPKMTALYERTRDAMVAFELAKLYEQAAQRDNAVEWYSMAWQRFQREQWRAKSAEALARLGAPLPEGMAAQSGADSAAQEAVQPARITATEPEPAEAETPQPEAQPQPPESAAPRKKSRRGRRGGRRRRGRGTAGTSETPPSARAVLPEPSRAAPPAARPAGAPSERGPIRLPSGEEEFSEAHASRLGRARAGDPAMSSRAAQLESQLRRLVAALPHGASEIDVAPAGPGVFLLSDSDLTSNYYIENCDTLRIAVKMVFSGARGRDRGPSVRSRLAEHLGINDAQAKKYMHEHCVARWIQLDEGAAHLAHYAIALLRPPLNE
jgi:hypothetical protein